jgi:Na+-translocating ferredoxin:NAD+ oxidoreductase subunit B
MMCAQRRSGGSGGGFGQGPSGSSSGRGGGRGGGFQPGPGGMCKCSACGEQVPHQQGVPCFNVKCPKCGAAMIRE